MEKIIDKNDKKMPVISAAFRFIREVLAIFIWVIVFIGLFITSVGEILISTVPQFEIVYQYRLLAILALSAFFWLILGTQRFFKFFGYIVAYPFVLVLWKLPGALIKNWAVVIAFSPAIYPLVKRFKTNFIVAVGIVLVAFTVCLAPADHILFPFSIILVGIYLLFHFIKRFKTAYSSSTIFTVLKGGVSSVWQHFMEHIADNIPEGDPESKEYKDKLGKNLLSAYMVTTSLHFVIAKLQEVIESRKLDLYFLSSLVWTFTITTVSFGVIYFGLYRMDSTHFAAGDDVGLLTFIGFSFSTLMTSSISNVEPVSTLTGFVAYVQLFFALLLIVLLVFIILTSIREKYKKDLDDLVFELRDAADKSKRLIESNYEITMEAVEHLLIRKDEEIMKFVLRIRYGKLESESMIRRLKELDGARSQEENDENVRHR